MRSTTPMSCPSACSRARSRRATDATRRTTSVVGEVRVCLISSRRCARRLGTTSRPRLPRGGGYSFSSSELDYLKTNNAPDLGMFRISPRTPPSRSKSSGSRLGKTWRRCVGICGTGRPKTLTGMQTRPRLLCRHLVSDHGVAWIFPFPPHSCSYETVLQTPLPGKAKAML